MATHPTPRPDNTALAAISSTLEVTNPEAPSRPECQQWAKEGLAKLTPLFDAHNGLITKERGLQSRLAENRNAIVKMTFDIGACLIEIKASLPKTPGRFGSTGWEYFTAQTKKLFGLDCGTASKYLSICQLPRVAHSVNSWPRTPITEKALRRCTNCPESAVRANSPKSNVRST